MKPIIHFSLNNKFALWLLTIIITVAGIYAGMNMKQETIPNLDVPVLSVSTAYPGAGSEEVADKISKPLEQRLKNLEGVKTVSSTSMSNFSNITLEYDYDLDMDRALSDVREAIAGFQPPAGAEEPKAARFNINSFPVVSLSVTGENTSLEELTTFVEQEVKPALEGLSAAIAIVYLLLVITFGRALAPFTILFSLPFIIIGAFVGLWIAGESLSASAMMGALMLIGIVVTNAIVLIDRVIHKEREGLSTREALLEAAGTRLRPILMTALATIGALLPLALGFESTSGSLISKGLGVTVIGGLTSSTLLTLLIVPIVYEFFMKFRKRKSIE